MHMDEKTRCAWGLALPLMTVGASGCLMAGNYHTAKTLDKGTSQTGLTFSTTRYQNVNSDGSLDAVAIPNVVPEFTYHLGVGANTEVGGRVALGSLGFEGDVKHRILRNDKLHLAIAPALSYQAAVVYEAIGGRLPLIGTVELSDMVDVTAAGFVAQTNFSGASSDFASFKGNLTSTGASIGLDLHGESLSIRPAFEFTQYVADFSAGNDFHRFNTVNFLVHVAWTGGRDKQQLNRIERKLDALGAPPAATAPAPASAPVTPVAAPEYGPAPAPGVPVYEPAPAPVAP